MNNQTKEKLSVEELTSRLLKRRTIIRPFRWKYSVDDCTCLLTAAYQAQVQARGGQCIMDGYTTSNIMNVAKAMNNLCGVKRGFILCGDCGNGKTTMMHAVAAATELLQDDFGAFTHYKPGYGTYKDDVHYTFADAMDCAYAERDGVFATAAKPILVIEDMGQEPLEVQSYGNIYNPVIDILEKRYERSLPTFITTNLDPQQLGKRYGKRIQDRLREMMFTIPFDNPSYRK